MKNPYAWTKLANLVVLESPTGVGYSYCSTQINGGVCKNTDKLTAAAARVSVPFYGWIGYLAFSNQVLPTLSLRPAPTVQAV